MNLTLLLGVVALALASQPAVDPPTEALRWTLDRPDLQVEALLALFRGAKAPHPAAALAGWKRANGGATGFSKAIDAGITLLNPETVRELRSIDRSTGGLSFVPGTGAPLWYVQIPADDGTIAALATALALTDGSRAAPIGLESIDRLGPAGAPWMRSGEGVVTLAGRREDLDREVAFPGIEAEASGGLVRFWLDPAGWRTSPWLPARQAAESLLALGISPTEGQARMDGQSLRLRTTSPLPRPDPADGLDLRFEEIGRFPTIGLAGFFAVAIGSRPEGWDAVFQAMDRAIKADPRQSQVAPIRTRINLVALPAGILPEADLWPHLHAFALALYGAEGRVTGVRFRIRTSSDDAARKIARQIVPKAFARLGLLEDDPGRFAEDAPPAGRISGWPVRLEARGEFLVGSWGVGPDFALRDPERVVTIPEFFGEVVAPDRLRRLAVVWPSRLKGLVEADSPLETGLDGASPLVWVGGSSGMTRIDEIVWPGLDRVVRGFLDRLPMDRPPQTANAPRGVP